MSEKTESIVSSVNSVLADAGITYTPDYVPSTYDPKSKDWQGICWRITFTSSRGSMQTDFKQGIGNLPNYPKGGKIMMRDEELIRASLRSGRACRGETSPIADGAKFAPPSAADVLSCLLSDANAEDYATYDEWAVDYGYDADSRKGEAVYNACLKIARDLRRVLGHDTLELLKPIVREV